MWITIKAYALLWNAGKHKGIIKVILEDESEHKIVVKSSREFLVISNMLKQKIVAYRPETGSISTAWARPDQFTADEFHRTDTYSETDEITTDIIFEEWYGDDPEKDNLKKIPGIGKAVEEKLNSAGIYTFLQIANWEQVDIDKISNQIGTTSSTIEKDDWVAKAKEQHLLKYPGAHLK